jgi:hypothetical protein
MTIRVLFAYELGSRLAVEKFPLRHVFVPAICRVPTSKQLLYYQGISLPSPYYDVIDCYALIKQ